MHALAAVERHVSCVEVLDAAIPAAPREGERQAVLEVATLVVRRGFVLIVAHAYEQLRCADHDRRLNHDLRVPFRLALALLAELLVAVRQQGLEHRHCEV